MLHNEAEQEPCTCPCAGFHVTSPPETIPKTFLGFRSSPKIGVEHIADPWPRLQVSLSNQSGVKATL